MKNILLLTAEYPNPDSSFDTPVIHYFTKEWVEMGYNVKVVHYRSVFPIFYYWIAIIFNNLIKRLTGTDFIPTKRKKKDTRSIMDGVLVYSFPIFKLIPHGKYSAVTIRKQINKILKFNKEDNFVPDIIIGHFYNPQLEIISKLKKHYPKTKTSIVLHEKPEIIKETYPKDYLTYFKDIDIWGFRFKPLKENFETIFGHNYKTFICHSGVPQGYVFSSTTNKKFENKIQKFCYVGMLIPLKRVCDIITALHQAFPLKDFELMIVGEGMERKNLEKLIKELDVEENVKLLGRKKRSEVQTIINEADCFIMVSESEAFGLVYLEAMSKGCITIGTRGQGIDGVIKNGINGYLCDSKNNKELAGIIRNLNSIPNEELMKLSQNAIDTAIEMTDRKVAEKYIDIVLRN